MMLWGIIFPIIFSLAYCYEECIQYSPLWRIVMRNIFNILPFGVVFNILLWRILFGMAISWQQSVSCFCLIDRLRVVTTLRSVLTVGFP